ncbi:SPOR domain-containing protein [Brachyspira hyodysenteriae]|uniref:SPOR domain-containing protein n=1 Tax=Brachyspira hyodysenteriae TaxID=159 RepID=UPI00063D9EA6|nr:SPOR domain-containing protein [Brachyspira hyodysenteriae]KLI14720.1 sporulation protein [Brachyspira hyodysenteriae]KLI18306.1 sporulation protein [Brachyspira hyodysenteriae]KLI20493.1 sporulation protein [Brachyspira hyodysenteriae]KLI31863.1 sporulation protein [Brachyspira hyodysenteriae]KLI32594.1 sporulation protein [Brachyspira hyodysenteriae]
MELNQNPNTEEKGSSINYNIGRRKTLYIVNFTPIRLLIFSISSVALILFIFVLGFHLGGSKPVHANNNDDSIAALMRNAQDGENMAATETSTADMPNDDITALSEYDAAVNNNSIIREGNTSADRYNEYTQNLASELDAINENIKEKDTAGLAPNTTYTPPQQMVSIPPVKPTSTTAKSTVPYSRSSSADSIYFIQVAVGYDKDNTYSARDSLKAKFPKAFIKEETMSDGKMMYKLKIGRYETREEAQKALAEIKKIPAYKDSYIYSDKKVS